MEDTMKIFTGLAVISLSLLILYVTAAAFDNLPEPAPPSYEEEEYIVKEVGEPKTPSNGILLSGDCLDYIDLTGMILPIEVAGTTVGASNDYGPFGEQPPCWRGTWDIQSSAGPDVTYKWTAPAAGEYTVSLCGSYFDNGLLLYRSVTLRTMRLTNLGKQQS